MRLQGSIVIGQTKWKHQMAGLYSFGDEATTRISSVY